VQPRRVARWSRFDGTVVGVRQRRCRRRPPRPAPPCGLGHAARGRLAGDPPPHAQQEACCGRSARTGREYVNDRGGQAAFVSCDGYCSTCRQLLHRRVARITRGGADGRRVGCVHGAGRCSPLAGAPPGRSPSRAASRPAAYARPRDGSAHENTAPLGRDRGRPPRARAARRCCSSPTAARVGCAHCSVDFAPVTSPTITDFAQFGEIRRVDLRATHAGGRRRVRAASRSFERPRPSRSPARAAWAESGKQLVVYSSGVWGQAARGRRPGSATCWSAARRCS